MLLLPTVSAVLGVSTELGGPDPYVQVTNGRLAIRCPFKNAICGKAPCRLATATETILGTKDR
jgi:hypothetical protein